MDKTARIFVNDDRTVLVQIWEENETTFVTVATRDHPGDTWGPPVWTNEEKRAFRQTLGGRSS